jgi:hypothetical protein
MISSNESIRTSTREKEYTSMNKQAKKAKRSAIHRKRIAKQGKCVVVPKGETLPVLCKEDRDALRVMHKPGEAGSAVVSRKLWKNFTGKNVPVTATPRRVQKRTKSVMGEVLGDNARRVKTQVPMEKEHKSHEDFVRTEPVEGAFRKPTAVAIDRVAGGIDLSSTTPTGTMVLKKGHDGVRVLVEHVQSMTCEEKRDASAERSADRKAATIDRQCARASLNDIQKAKRYAKVKARLEAKAVRKAALAKPASGVRPRVWMKEHPTSANKVATVHPNGPYAPRWAA